MPTVIVSLSQLAHFLGQEITLQGWVYNKRSSGSIHFLQLRDGTGMIQGVVVKNEVPEEIFNVCLTLTLESSVKVTGFVREEKRAPSGFELTIKNIEIIQLAPDDYPIGKKEHGPDFLLSHRHLWLRSPRQWAIQRIRNELIRAMYDFYYNQGFIKIDTPIFTPNACEGTTTLFQVDYFGETVYLSQSGQLYLEAAIASFGKVFDFAPVFRSEKSKTRRHLTEFWMSNAEMAFFDQPMNMALQEEMIIYLVQRILQNCSKELTLIERDTKPLEKIQSPFIHIPYKEVITELHKLGSDIQEGEDLGNDDETILTAAYNQPIFIENYPAHIKAFYMKRVPGYEEYALCSDLLAPEGYGEIIGGSQREDKYDRLVSLLQQHHLKVEDFQWYLDLRKYGSVPHSGFGIGLERLVAWICGLQHVRETIPFPRMLNRVRP